MKVGDLVRMTEYHHWGLGMIVALDEDVAAFVHWAEIRNGWRYIEDLEIL